MKTPSSLNSTNMHQQHQQRKQHLTMEKVVKFAPLARMPLLLRLSARSGSLNLSKPTSQASSYVSAFHWRLKIETEPSGSFSAAV